MNLNHTTALGTTFAALGIGFQDATTTDAPASGGDSAAAATPDAPAADAPAADSEPKTVLNHMPSRSTFATADDALAFLTRMSEECTDWAEYADKAITVGLTEDGAFDPEVYSDSMLVTVARVTAKGKRGADGKMEKETQVVAIAVYPTPKLDAVLAEDAGKKWLADLIEKEANLVAMRPVRAAVADGDLSKAPEAMPKTLADYWTPSTSAGSGTLATYNELWQAVRDATGTKIPAVKQAGLSKKVFRNCLESASFADEAYPRLETRKNKAGTEYSAFVYALHIGIALAKEEGLDPAFFENALATRDDKVIEIGDTGEDDIDLDILTEDGGEEATA